MDYQQTVYLRVKGYENSIGSYILHTDFVEHVHHYNVEYISNDEDTHRCLCDCGEYINVEHEWFNAGTNKIRCYDCLLIIVGTVPGGTIMSVDENAEYAVDIIDAKKPYHQNAIVEKHKYYPNA